MSNITCKAKIKSFNTQPNNYMIVNIEVISKNIKMTPGQSIVINNNTYFILMENNFVISILVKPDNFKDYQPNNEFKIYILDDMFNTNLIYNQINNANLNNDYIIIKSDDHGFSSLMFFCQKLTSKITNYNKQVCQFLNKNILIICGFDEIFPFLPAPSKIFVPLVPNNIIACQPFIEDNQLASRLCSTKESAGCFLGKPDELANIVVKNLNKINPDINIKLFSFQKQNV